MASKKMDPRLEFLHKHVPSIVARAVKEHMAERKALSKAPRSEPAPMPSEGDVSEDPDLEMESEEETPDDEVEERLPMMPLSDRRRAPPPEPPKHDHKPQPSRRERWGSK